MIGDQLTFGEVRAQQALLHRILEAVGLGQVHETVGVEGGAAASDVEAEGKLLACRHRRQPLLGFARLLDGHAVLRRQALGAVAGALARRAGVELEAPPRHTDVIAVLEQLKRRFEAALADVAPWASDVRPDLHIHSRLPYREDTQSHYRSVPRATAPAQDTERELQRIQRLCEKLHACPLQ